MEKKKRLESLEKFKLNSEKKKNIFAGQGGPVREFIDIGGTVTSNTTVADSGVTCDTDFVVSNDQYYGWGNCHGN